jgi:hypothetical protein
MAGRKIRGHPYYPRHMSALWRIRVPLKRLIFDGIFAIDKQSNS